MVFEKIPLEQMALSDGIPAPGEHNSSLCWNGQTIRMRGVGEKVFQNSCWSYVDK